MPHQVKGFNAFWAAYDHGERNICLTGPCGTGKTFLTTMIVHEAARRGLRVNFVTHRKLLLAQTSKVFIEENLPHGIRAADYEPDLDQSIQLSSRDTEISRCVQSNRMSPVMADIVIIDEAHVNKAGEILKLLEMQREMQPEMCVVGLTATPVDIWHMYDHLIKFASNSEMRASTPALHLPCRVFAPDVMDISMLKRNKTGDFVDGEGNPWSDAKTAPTIFGRVLPHYKAYNPEQRPALLFAPSVASSLYFVDLFIAAGIPAAHIDGECIYRGEKNPDGSQKVDRTTEPAEREKVFEDLRSGKIKIISNRFIAVEGLDLPQVYHLILATPFGSLTTYLQVIGRVQRAHPSLPGHVIVQDHGGSVIRFGHPDLDRDWKVGDSWQDFVKDNDIEDNVTQPEKNKEENREEILCECGQYRMGGPVCPNCGKSAPKRHIMVLQINGTLKPLTKKKIDKSKLVPSPVKGMSGALHAMSHSGKMTYNQALALLKREHPSLKWHTNIDSQGNKRHAVLVDGDIWFAPMLPPIDDKHAWALKVSKTDREFKRLYNLPSQ
jgi:superfamily II DNA or RNA helicase